MKTPCVLLFRGWAVVLLSLVVSAPTVLVRADVPDFLWLQTPVGSGGETPQHIVVDNAGNSYVAGKFTSTNVSFGAGIVISNAVRSGSIPNNAFIAKYDANGAPVWARAFGGSNNDLASGIAVDSQQNIYVAGQFSSTNFLIAGVALTNFAPGGRSSLYVAKFNPAGNLLWVRTSDTNTYSISNPFITVDGSGNSYVTATFSGTNSISGTNLISQGSTDILLAKYDSAGNLVWLRQAGGSDLELSAAVTLDKAGNAYLLGNSRSANASFGSFTFSVQGPSGDQDVIVAKYNPAGTVLWAKQFGGTDIEYGRSIAVDNSGNVFITGDFSGGSFPIGTNTLVNSNAVPFSALFIAKLDASGNPLWAKTAQGDYLDSSLEVAVDYLGNSYIAGFFQSSKLVFNSAVTLTNSAQTAFADADAYVAKFDAAGNLVWATRPFGLNDQRAYTIAVDSAANAYVAGWTQGTDVVFGTLSTTNAYLDLFVTKIDSDYPVLRIEKAGSSALLSWPANKSAFMPQVTSNFQSWTNLTGVTMTNGGRIFYTNALADKAFFRLKKD